MLLVDLDFREACWSKVLYSAQLAIKPLNHLRHRGREFLAVERGILSADDLPALGYDTYCVYVFENLGALGRYYDKRAKRSDPILKWERLGPMETQCILFQLCERE